MFEQVKPNLYVFYSPNEGANCYLLVGKKIAMVDSGLRKNEAYLKDSLNVLGFDAGEVDLVLHTHGHADHFTADGLFSNAEIRMHAFDANYVNTKDAQFTASGFFGEPYYPAVKSFYAENDVIDLRPFSLKVLFTPGHTKGSVCFFEEKEGLLFSGDTLFKDGVGRVDLLSGNGKEMIASVNKLKKLDFGMLLPGHGTIVKGRQGQNIENALKMLGSEFI